MSAFAFVSLSVTSARAQGAPTFTAYSHTGVATPSGLAAAGKYVWISDWGRGFKKRGQIVRVDISTGATRSVSNRFISLPSVIAASDRYAWVMNKTYKEVWSLLRIDTTTLSVTRVKISAAESAGIGYEGDPIVLAGGYVWIPGPQGIIRVSTSTLVTSTIKSRLIAGPLFHVVADAHYLWMNVPVSSNGPLYRSFIRISLRTGVVTNVSLPGVEGGIPLGDDGINMWVQNKRGIQKVNPSTGAVTTIEVPRDAQVTIPVNGQPAVANGIIYFCAGLVAQSHTGVVGIGIHTGIAGIVSSPLIYQAHFVSAANGFAWVVNYPVPGKPLLVRIS